MAVSHWNNSTCVQQRSQQFLDLPVHTVNKAHAKNDHINSTVWWWRRKVDLAETADTLQPVGPRCRLFNVLSDRATAKPTNEKKSDAGQGLTGEEKPHPCETKAHDQWRDNHRETPSVWGPTSQRTICKMPEELCSVEKGLDEIKDLEGEIKLKIKTHTHCWFHEVNNPLAALDTVFCHTLIRSSYDCGWDLWLLWQLSTKTVNLCLGRRLKSQFEPIWDRFKKQGSLEMFSAWVWRMTTIWTHLHNASL